VSILRRILGEQRAVGGTWITDNQPSVSSAGVSLNSQTALSLGAYYAAVKLYADTVASLPWDTYIRVDGTRRPYRPAPSWLTMPQPLNANFTAFDLKHRMISSLLIDGNCFVLLIKGRTGDIVEMRPLDPQRVTIKSVDGAPIYTVTGDDNVGVELTSDAILHIPLFATGSAMRAPSPVEQHRTTLGLASATQLYSAKFYEQGAAPSAVIRIPGELTQDQADSLRNSFSRRHEGIEKMHKIAVLTGGADFQQVSMKITDMQLVETLHWGVESIARLMGVPLQLLQYPEATSYATSEVLMQAWLRLGLGPLVTRVEAGLQRLVPGADQTFIKFTIDGLLRPTTKERYDSYAIALNNGILSLNEIRRLEDRSDVEGGDEHYKALNIGTVGSENIRSEAEAAGVLVRAGFDPMDSAKVAGLPAMKHTGAPPVTLQADAPIEVAPPVVPEV
jgi:HK97 family phage portal protein